MKHSEKPDLTEPCCGWFVHFAKHFQWMSYEDFPELLSMPYIQVEAEKLRVNFCPACGKMVRYVNIAKKDII